MAGPCRRTRSRRRASSSSRRSCDAHRVTQTESTPPLWYALPGSLPAAGPARRASGFSRSPSARRWPRLSSLFRALRRPAACDGRRADDGSSAPSSCCTRRSCAPTSCSPSSRSRSQCSCSALLDRPARRFDVALAATVAAGCLTHLLRVLGGRGARLAVARPGCPAHPAARHSGSARGRSALAAASAPMMVTQYGQGALPLDRRVPLAARRGGAVAPLHLRVQQCPRGAGAVRRGARRRRGRRGPPGPQLAGRQARRSARGRADPPCGCRVGGGHADLRPAEPDRRRRLRRGVDGRSGRRPRSRACGRSPRWRW